MRKPAMQHKLELFQYNAFLTTGAIRGTSKKTFTKNKVASCSSFPQSLQKIMFFLQDL